MFDRNKGWNPLKGDVHAGLRAALGAKPDQPCGVLVVYREWYRKIADRVKTVDVRYLLPIDFNGGLIAFIIKGSLTSELTAVYGGGISVYPVSSVPPEESGT